VTKTVCVLGLSSLLIAGLCDEATAQSRPAPETSAFINVGIGAQPQQRTVNATDTFSLFDELATIASTAQIRKGAMFEVGGGYRVAPQFAIAAGFSSFGRPGTGTLTASIPDPLVYDQPMQLSRDASDLAHTERGVHLQAVYFIPVGRNVDLSLSAGPSFIHVSQQIATASVSSDAQNVEIASKTESGTATGINAGMQVNYMFAPRYGVGFFVGYAGGSVDLPSAPGLKVGGVRTGFALQARF
jgi:hypothetical protein